MRVPLALLALLLAAAPAFGAAACPAVEQALTLVDSNRGRSIAATLRLPAGNGRLATILWAPGMGGTRTTGAVWARAWVQAGLGVLQLQFPGADAAVYASPDPAERQARVQAAISPAAQADRTADIRFVADELARRRDDACGLGRVDLDRLGLAGHSIGAWAVLALAGQGGARFADRRFRAFAAFSATALPLPERQAAYASIRAPMLTASGSRDGLLPPGDAAALAQARDARTGMFAAMPADGRKALLWLAGADHMAFAGTRSDAAASHANAAVIATTTGWWRRWLLDDRGAMPALALAAGDEWQRK